MNHAVLIARLRWTLFKNSLRRRANVLEFIMGVLAFIIFGSFAVAISIGLGALTYAAYTRDFFAPMLGVVLAAILIIWQLMPLFTASFGSDLNVSRFRIYPLTTRALFLIDMMLGMFDPVALLAMILLIGIFSGVVLASPHAAPLAAIGLGLFVAFNVALARYVQRLLAALFASRRRKELLALFIFLLLLVPQTLIMTQQRPADRRSRRGNSSEVEFAKQRLRDLEAVGRAIRWTPPGVAAGTLNSETEDTRTELLLILVGVVFAAAVVVLEYNRIARDHLGVEAGGRRRKKAHPSGDQGQSRSLVKAGSSRTADIRSRFVGVIESLFSPVSAAVFEKDLRYIYRSPRALLIAIAPIAGSVIFILPGTPFTRSDFAGQYRLAGILLYCLVVSSQLLNNCFAFDWHGAKLYFTSPARGRSILIGKNLAASVSITLQVLLIVSAFSLLSGPVSVVAFINAAFVLSIVFPVNLAVGNYLSVMYPRGIDFSKIYGKSYSGVSAAIGLAVLPVILGILGLGPVIGWLLKNQMIVYAVFAIETTMAVAAYFAVTKRAGCLLEGRAEEFLQGLFTSR